MSMRVPGYATCTIGNKASDGAVRARRPSDGAVKELEKTVFEWSKGRGRCRSRGVHG